MYKNGSKFICARVYKRLSESDKKNWEPYWPDYAKMEQRLRDQSGTVGLLFGEFAIPENR